MDQWQGPHPGRRSRVGWTAVVGKINNRVSKLIFFYAMAGVYELFSSN